MREGPLFWAVFFGAALLAAGEGEAPAAPAQAEGAAAPAAEAAATPAAAPAAEPAATPAAEPAATPAAEPAATPAAASEPEEPAPATAASAADLMKIYLAEQRERRKRALEGGDPAPRNLEKDEQVIPAWKRELARLGPAAGSGLVTELDRAETMDARLAALVMISALPPQPAAREAVLRLVGNADALVAAAALHELGRLADPRDAEVILKQLVSGREEVNAAAKGAFYSLVRSGIEKKQPIPPSLLRAALEGRVESEAGAIVVARLLAHAEGPTVALEYAGRLESPRARAACLAIAAESVKNPEIAAALNPILLAAVSAPEEPLAAAAIRISADLNLLEAVPAIAAHLAPRPVAGGAEPRKVEPGQPAPMQPLQSAAIRALRKLTGLKYENNLSGWQLWWSTHEPAMRGHFDALAKEAENPPLAAVAGLNGTFIERAKTAERMTALLAHTDPQLRAAACRTLASFRLPESAEAFRTLLADPDPAVKEAARAGCRLLGVEVEPKTE